MACAACAKYERIEGVYTNFYKEGESPVSAMIFFRAKNNSAYYILVNLSNNKLCIERLKHGHEVILPLSPTLNASNVVEKSQLYLLLI